MDEEYDNEKSEAVNEFTDFHRKILEDWCRKVEGNVKEIWPLIEEYCGDYFEIDMGKVLLTIRKKDPDFPINQDIPDDWWHKVRDEEEENEESS